MILQIIESMQKRGGENMIEFIGGVITGILVMIFVELVLWKCVI